MSIVQIRNRPFACYATRKKSVTIIINWHKRSERDYVDKKQETFSYIFFFFFVIMTFILYGEKFIKISVFLV